MNKKTLAVLIRYIAAAAVAGLMAWVVTHTYGLAEAESRAEQYRILCDAFTIPGMVFLMVGLLIRLSDSGAIDGLTYAMRSLYRVFLPMAARDDETFLDYVQRRRAEKKGKGTGFILHVGILFMIPAILFLILFYRLYPS